MKKHRHDLRCLRISRSQIQCLITGKKVSTRVKWKRDTGILCPHGLKVFEVNGSHVRNNFDSDFDQGGQGYRYRFIPKHEIWIDSHVPKAERAYVIHHECYEATLMSKGRSYDSAHKSAKRIEDRMRRRDRPGE